MQFKYPELLWALFLLLIPVFIHLFQLRRFKKTPFTNVKLLQKVVAESRRSNSLKKWLLLFTRMALFAVMILAFAQPFFANKTALQKKETVIYLDDSFSMQCTTNNSTLLANAVQNLIKSVPEEQVFSLFTNEKVYTETTIKEIQNDLLLLSPTPKQLTLDEVYLKARTLFGTDAGSIKNVVVLSDFQQRIGTGETDASNDIKRHLVKLTPESVGNVAIDSVYSNTAIGAENIELNVLLSSTHTIESTPVSLFNGEKLIAKTSAAFTDNKKATISFTIPKNEAVKGKITISDPTGPTYDNQLYFNIDTKEKIKVLVIGTPDSAYLKRIFTENEFEFSSFSLKNLNYGILDDQNMIVLNELNTIPNALATSLRSFSENGGSIVVVPSNEIDRPTYNLFTSNYFSTRYQENNIIERNITDISFSHPLYQNVFEKKVDNFQYPKVSQYYTIKTNAQKILSFQDANPFLIGSGNAYFFTAPISTENSNFKNSPLIVPTFYNMGINSLKLPDLYEVIGFSNKIDVPLQLTKDNILKVSKGDYEFIPQQNSFANKVRLSFYENPNSDGIYSVTEQGNILKNISFNYPRSESKLNYIPIENIAATSKQASISSFFEQMQNDNSIDELWKWFIILAILFVLVEVLLQKYLK